MSEDFLMHVGRGHLDDPPGPGSGRKPWGSGENPYQHDEVFIQKMKRAEDKYGIKAHKQIADELGMTVDQYRKKKRNELDLQKLHYAYEFVKMKEQGISNLEMSRRTGVPDTTIGNMIRAYESGKLARGLRLQNNLRESVDRNKVIDISTGIENYLGCTKDGLAAAAKALQDEGYEILNLKIKQLGTNKDTKYAVLAAPGTTYSDAYEMQRNDMIAIPGEYSTDGGETYHKDTAPFVAIDPKRVYVRYAEDGGTLKDGTIELRPGVEDLSLGGKGYAQVRINVGNTHYLKGMAMYANDGEVPPGYDIIFNTNKKKDVPMMGEDKNNTVLKPLKIDPKTGEPDALNPFGASVVRKKYTDADGNEQMSALNIVGSGLSANEEGRWDEWTKALSSQFLAKQPIELIHRQLNLSRAETESQLEELSKVTNPVVKQKLMLDLAAEADRKAVELKGAALPGQSTCVMLPVVDMDPKECFCRRFESGTEVIAIRFPLGTVAEIPKLRVNNEHESCLKNESFRQSRDAIGMSPVTAAQMSGADFDGDTCVVIPVSNFKFNVEKAIQELVEFEPKISYKLPEGKKSNINKQMEMGKIANLLNDMQVAGASPTAEDVIRAVKYSMVVIDAEKHNLDYQKAYKDFDIAGLKKKYRGSSTAGAATIISKKKSPTSVFEREDLVPTRDINPETGEITYRQKMHSVKNKETGEWERVPYYANKAIKDEEGNTIGWEETKTPKTIDVPYLSTVKDAYEAVGDRTNDIEIAYAEYSNSMKALANRIRKEAVAIPMSHVEPSAKSTFAKEVKSLNDKLKDIEANKPLERAAQRRANYIVSSQVADDPAIKTNKKRKDEYKRLKFQALERGREEVGISSKVKRMDITEKEWEAINAGAISASRINQILIKTDSKRIRELAAPHTARPTLSETQKRQIINRIDQGIEPAKVAKDMGVSISTVFDICYE